MSEPVTDDNLPRFRPICPVCDRVFPSGRDEKRLATLRRMIAFLRDKQIPRARADQRSWLQEELAAMEWALALIEAK